MWKNFTSSTGPPFSFSMICQAFGPWIWNRQYLRETGWPYGRDGERSSLVTSTL